MLDGVLAQLERLFLKLRNGLLESLPIVHQDQRFFR